jgi:hypothetical protein
MVAGRGDKGRPSCGTRGAVMIMVIALSDKLIGGIQNASL